MCRRLVLATAIGFAITTLSLAWASSSEEADPGPLFVDQGPGWTPEERASFYTRDQGSRLIPLSWLLALEEPAGDPFMRDDLRRYGYLPNPDEALNPHGLPVGFTVGLQDGEETVGMNCAACHVREISVDGTRYRIDGGPAITDFESFLRDLDLAVGETLKDPDAFAAFALRVGSTPDTELRARVDAWYEPFHEIIHRSLPEQLWGWGRLDAVSMIFNRLAGLDIGPEETNYIIAENIVPADAPTRYPFLWNASRQDRIQWPGFSANGNAQLGLSRNLGEVLGVFAIFRPVPDPTKPSGLDFLAVNSADFDGLFHLEDLVMKIGPPAWPWHVDEGLARQGADIYARECNSCHGIRPGTPRPPATDTWATPVQNVGTDTREWRVLGRTSKAGVLTGVVPPGGTVAVKAVDSTALLLTTANRSIRAQRFPDQDTGPDVVPETEPGSYESRVLQGIWAAAPYLHNGSVPSLAELLKPAAERISSFEIGTTYDPVNVGVAVKQPGPSSPLVTDDCTALDSGNSNCGHEYGTELSNGEKAALLEYMKTL